MRRRVGCATHQDVARGNFDRVVEERRRRRHMSPPSTAKTTISVAAAGGKNRLRALWHSGRIMMASVAAIAASSSAVVITTPSDRCAKCLRKSSRHSTPKRDPGDAPYQPQVDHGEGRPEDRVELSLEREHEGVSARGDCRKDNSDSCPAPARDQQQYRERGEEIDRD